MEPSVEGEGIDEAECFGAGIAFTEGTVGKMGERKAEAMPISKSFGEFDAGAEFGIKAKIESIFGVVITTAEAGSEDPAMTQLQIDQYAHGGIEGFVLSSTEEEPRSKSVEPESGAVFNAPESLQMAVENLCGTGVEAEKGRIVREPLMRGMGGKRTKSQQAG